MEYTIVGIPNHTYSFPEEIRRVLPLHKVFSGGKRHYELVKPYLQTDHQWIMIEGNMGALLTQYQETQSPILVFASGDPLFYGIAQTIRTHQPKAKLTIYPYFNSIQRLCTKLCISYQHIKNTSVHGRGWKELDMALLRHEPMIAVLTDRVHTPAAVAQRLLEYQFTNYALTVGEDLDGSQERINTYTLEEAAQTSFHELNCVLLRQTTPSRLSLGIDDHLFEGLAGRPNMITKKAIRLATLSRLQLEQSHVFWDIGFCTGSIAIEAQRLFPHLQVVAFEKREECREIMNQNTKKLSAPGIEVHMGDFFALTHSLLPKPDAVFIGGHGNRLTEMMHIIHTVIQNGGTIVMNAVKETSQLEFSTHAIALGWQLHESERVQLDQHNPIWILKAIKHEN